MNNLRVLSIIAVHTFREQWKNRFFQLILIFGAFMIYAALLVGAMAQEQEGRVLLNFGLGLIELVGLAAVMFGCASAVLKDMETKTIYLLLSRPLPRWVYLLGKYAGITLSVAAAIAAMGAVHATLLLLKGVSPGHYYVQMLLSSCCKTMIAGALAVLVSLISTSVLSAVIITSVFWTLGHFLKEIRFVASQFGGAAGAVSKLLFFAVPNMQVFSLNDWVNTSSRVFAGWPAMISYVVIYCGACMALSVWFFRRREF